MAPQQDSVDRLSQMPPEISHEIIREATISSIGACRNNSRNHHSRRFKEKSKSHDKANQNPNIGIPLTSRLLNNMYSTAIKEHDTMLNFCTIDCAAELIKNAGPSMLADARNITLKDRMSASRYEDLSDVLTWERFKRHKWQWFVRHISDAIGKDMQCSRVGGTSGTEVKLLWILPVS